MTFLVSPEARAIGRAGQTYPKVIRVGLTCFPLVIGALNLMGSEAQSYAVSYGTVYRHSV